MAATTVTRLRNFVSDKNSNIPITASYVDAELDQLVASLNSKVLAKATAPSSPTSGDTWIDTSTTPPQLKVYDGTNWNAVVLNYQASAVASATTTDLGAAIGPYLHITGTTTITGLGTVAAGTIKFVVFDGILTFTHNATSLILPTGANITTAAGDAAILLSEGSGNWRCLSYNRKDGTSVAAGSVSVGGAWRGLSVTRTNATTVNVTATELVVYDTSLNPRKISSVNVSPAITSSGANGLDTGSEAANTIYYIWVIRKSSDGTVAGLLSTASAIGSITFPNGYDQAALVSAVGNNNSSDFINFTQTGTSYKFVSWGYFGTGNVGTSPWVSLDLTPANMSTNACFIPSGLSNIAELCIACKGTVIGLTNDNTTTDGSATARNKYYLDGSNLSMNISSYQRIDVITADTLYWISNGTDCTVYCIGFEINKLT